MFLNFLFFGAAWLVGIAAGAFRLAPPIIIVAFAIPFTYEMKRKGVLTSTAPAKRFMVSFAMLLGLFAVLSWAMWHFFPKYGFWGYVLGLVLTVLPSLGKCGRSEDNITDFFEINAEDVDQEALVRYLGRSTGQNDFSKIVLTRFLVASTRFLALRSLRPLRYTILLVLISSDNFAISLRLPHRNYR